MIRALGLSYGYTSALLLDEVNFTVGNGMKVGLVGPNGAGKSTLFGLLLGHDEPRKGKVVTEGTIALVPQEVKRDPILDASTSVKSYVDPDNKFADYELKTMFAGLEMPDLPLEAVPGKLSGGQKTKLALMRALLLEPDILLLDEPTNFLDIPGKRWVMDLLAHYKKTLIMVSHDLNLLDAHIDKVLALNKQTKKIEEYKGNYTQYLKLKAEADALLVRHIVIEQKKIKKMEESVQKMAGRKTEKGVHQRIILQRRLEKAKANMPEMPKEIQRIKLQLQKPAWVGELPIRIMRVSKSYGEISVLRDVTFSIKRGEKVVLLGRNGAGKSTLIKIMMDILQPDAGEIDRDEKLKVGYYSQEFETFDLNMTLLEVMREHSTLPEGSLRSFLGRFLFGGEKVRQRVATLSGGEKTRLSIAILMLNDYNLLILDEPTTYLDPLSQRVILEALKEYKGSMLLVSHTEDFVKELEPDKAYILPDEELHFWSEELLDLITQT